MPRSDVDIFLGRMKFRTILLFGAPGAGKGTQGKILGTIPNFFHCACGDVFRNLTIDSELGRRFVEYSSRGDLVPDETTIQLWRENIQAQKQLGMKEGFDVGLEMSGSAAALRSMLANMCHGGKIAMLGIPEPDTQIDWNLVVFNSLTIQGIYGREMYETWYKMTVMLQSGLDISPVITHHFHYTEFEKAFEIMRSGQSGKVILNWVKGEKE